jgi:PhnB protein
MEINAYLSFDGRCAEAFAFYARVMGGDILVTMPYAGSPIADEVTEDWGDKVMHARLRLGRQVVMGSDSMPGRYEAPRGMTMSINIDDPAEADRIFAAMAEGGVVHMPVQETFWALRFGVLVDRFGIPWMVNCEKAVSPTGRD